MSAPTVLVSLCLGGVLCRYHGQRYRMGHDLTLPHSVVHRLRAAGYRLGPVCPEIDGGLPVPRPPAPRCKGGLGYWGTRAATETTRYQCVARLVPDPGPLGLRALRRPGDLRE